MALARRLVTWPFWNRDAERLRAGWRALVPAVLALAALVGANAALEALAPGWSPTIRGHVAVALHGFIVVPLLLVGWARHVDHRPVREYGLRLERRWSREFAVGATLGALVLLLAAAAHVALDWATVTAVLEPGRLPLLLGLGALVVSRLAVGLWEEVIFRGLFLRNVAEGFAGWVSGAAATAGAVVVSSLTFGFLHLLNGGRPGVGLLVLWAGMGVVLGLAAVLTDSLALPVGMHAALDVAVVVLGFPGSEGAPRLVDLSFAGPAHLVGLEGALTVGCVLLLGPLTLVWGTRRGTLRRLFAAYGRDGRRDGEARATSD